MPTICPTLTMLSFLLRFRVLDECDEMLNMGFVDDVELILNAGGAENIQTLLFSATLPSWVKDIQKRFLKKDFKLVDLVGNEKQKVPHHPPVIVRSRT
jgi:ATP-dependent RNA helicase DDX21